MGKNIILSIKDLVVKFQLKDKKISIIKKLSLDLFHGESLALVGESASGKSVLAKSLIGLLDKNGWIDSGTIIYENQDISKFKNDREWRGIRGKEISMVFQEPMSSLNPLKTIGSQVKESVKLHRNLSGKKAKEKTIDILKEVGIKNPEERYKQFPHEFSGGMRQRVIIAIAIASNPKILICDEPTTALDVTVQRQILDLLKKLSKKYGLTSLFITHDFGVVANIADRVAVMYAGDIIEIGKVEEIFFNPKHPYTWSLLSSLPQLASKNQAMPVQNHNGPINIDSAKGDSYASRNPYALNIDYIKAAPYYEVSESHRVKSWLMDPRAPKVDAPKSIKYLRHKVWK